MRPAPPEERQLKARLALREYLSGQKLTLTLDPDPNPYPLNLSLTPTPTPTLTLTLALTLTLNQAPYEPLVDAPAGRLVGPEGGEGGLLRRR